MKKHNLVILHSFPTNSVILSGFYEFLADYFNVYPIDLPGFVKGSKPLEEATIENCSKHILKEIAGLHLKEYWIAGVSFGFYVANMVTEDKKCKGFLAIEPFIGASGLKMSKIKTFFFESLLCMINVLNVCYSVWENKFLHNHLFSKGCGSSIAVLNLMKQHVDPTTFFKIALEILRTKEVVFQNKPYVLIINPNDETVDARPITKKFGELGNRCYTAITTSDHFPEEISKRYFRKHVPEHEIGNILTFMSRF